MFGPPAVVQTVRNKIKCQTGKEESLHFVQQCMRRCQAGHFEKKGIVSGVISNPMTAMSIRDVLDASHAYVGVGKCQMSRVQTRRRTLPSMELGVPNSTNDAHC